MFVIIETSMNVMEMQQVLQAMLLVEENKVCADCQEIDKPVTHASVNNAALICQECSEKHTRELTPLISLIRPLDSDFWSQEQISTLKAGSGNREFNNFMAHFDLSEPDCDIQHKYNSVGCQYWRDKLHEI